MTTKTLNKKMFYVRLNPETIKRVNICKAHLEKTSQEFVEQAIIEYCSKTEKVKGI
jgi:predicted DNA-binding protein